MEKARGAYEKAIELSPQQVQSYVALARILNATSTPESVVAVYEQGVAANPENILLKSELANRYQLRGDDDGAVALLEEAYALDENAVIVRNNLAALLIRSPTEENLRRAQTMTQGFEASNRPALLDTLGWLRYKQGNIEQAIELLVRAQEAGGQGLEYWYHLGMAYAKNEQVELAKEQLAKALADENAKFYGRDTAEEVYNSL